MLTTGKLQARKVLVLRMANIVMDIVFIDSHPYRLPTHATSWDQKQSPSETTRESLTRKKKIALEVEELVPDGTADRWHGLIGKTAKQVKQASGSDWTGFTNI